MLNPNYTKETQSFDEVKKYHINEFNKLGRTLYYFLYAGVPYAIIDNAGITEVYKFPMTFTDKKEDSHDFTYML